ncbi:MAG: hypothetical protein NTV80_17380 [Verrucomicrobia bacterium]|nr:hypothetical protein [Verrucomicrobiota bacterium]
MTTAELIAEFDADLASMSKDELIRALEEVGCVFEEPWLDAFSEAGGRFDIVSAAANSDELALAA